MLRLALPILLLLAPAAPAQWSPPEPVSGGAGGSRPHTAFSPAGARMTAWTRYAGERPSIHVAGEGRVARRADWLSGPVGYGRRSFALAWAGERQRRLYARAGGAPRLVASGRRIVGPVLAGSARGQLALAWFDDRGTSNDEVLVSLRRPGGRFGRPLRLARERVRGVTVAVGERGEVLVAWDARGKVRARLRRPGSGFGRTDTIRSFPAFNARLQAAITANGRAIVGWTAKSRSEGGDAGPTYQQVAVRPAGAGRFRAAQLLSRTPDAPDAEGTLRLDVTREPLVAWTQADGVYRARAGGTGAFPAGEPVAPAGAVLQDVAGGIVFWVQDRRLHAGGEPVSGPGAGDADAAVDPLTGQPSVVWLEPRGVMTSTRQG